MTYIHNVRCRICQRVSSPELSSELSPLHTGEFHLEDDGLGYICSVCEDWDEELSADYNLDDEVDSYE